MKIFKKIDNVNMEQLNDSLRDLPCPGISINAKYDNNGILTIKNIISDEFCSSLRPTNKIINIHLFNTRVLSFNDYNRIAETLGKLNELATIILSSSHLSRRTLIAFKNLALSLELLSSNKFYIAAMDDIKTKKDTDNMIYSSDSRFKREYEFDRLVDYIKSNVPVLLDWSNNNQHRISTIIEKTNNSDNLIILSKKPKTIRRIESNI